MRKYQILQKCCYTKQTGYITCFAIGKPFRHGGYVFATNGHIAARIQSSAFPNIGEVKNVPTMDNIVQIQPCGRRIKLPATGSNHFAKFGSVCLGSNYIRLLKSFGVTHIQKTNNPRTVYWKLGEIDGWLATFQHAGK